MAKAKRRRSRGAGAIIKQASGNFAYQYVDGAGKRRTKSLRTKNRKEAEELAKEFEKAVNARDQVEVLEQAARVKQLIRENPLALSDVWTEYMKTCPTAGAGTLSNYERALRDLIRWLGGTYPNAAALNDVTAEICDEYLAHLWQSGVSANTFNYRKNALGAVVKALANKYGLQHNRWHDADTRRKEVKQKRLPLTAAQCLELLQSLNNPPVTLPHADECRTLVRFLLYTGSRLVDSVNMRWDSIDIETGRIEYTPRKTAGRGKVAELPILPPIYNELAALRTTSDSELVFPQLSAQYGRNPDAIKKPLIRLVQAVTGDGRSRNATTGQRKVNRAAYGVHSLRATFATQSAMAGCKPVWLARMLGDALARVDSYYIRAGIGDTMLSGFEELPKLTTSTGDMLPQHNNERAQLHSLVDQLSIENVQRMIQYANRLQQNS